MDPQLMTLQEPKYQIKNKATKSLNASLHHRVVSQDMNVSNMGFFTPSQSPDVVSYLDGYITPFQLEMDLANARLASKLKRKKTLSPGFDKYFDHKDFLNRQANQQIQSARLEALKSPVPLSSSKGFQELKDLPKLKLMETTQSKWDDGRTKQIWGDCLKLMDEYEAIKGPFLAQKKKKVKKLGSKTPRPEEPEKKKILEFWKKDEAFLKQRAQMEQEINKHREEVDMKNKIEDLLAEDVDEDDPLIHFRKSNLHHSHTHEDQHSERGMLKLIASKPRIFNLKSPLQLKEKDPFSSAPNSFAQQQSPNESSSNFVIPEQNQSSIKPLLSAQSSRGILLSSISPRTKMSPTESNFMISELNQSNSKPVFSSQGSRGLLFSSISTRKVTKNPSLISQQNSKQTLSLQSSRVEKQVIPFPFKNEGENPKHERIKSMSSRVKRVHISPFPNHQGTKNAALLLKEKLTQMDVKMVLLEKKCRNLSLLPNSMIGKNGLSIQEMYRGSPRRENKANCRP